ncbi:hypothetical protein KJ841_03170 [Patescibacteria group bacterium]|nr:hypothetical protein [Patescibacteria group bacterium]
MANFDGKKILSVFLYIFFVILLIVLTFLLVTWLLQKGEVLRPPLPSEEFPPGPLTTFPQPPEFIEIGDYYFSGPWTLETLENASTPISRDLFVLFAILCKRNEEYDIMYIGGTEQKDVDYECWMENCNQEVQNLYFAVFLSSSDPVKIKDNLNRRLNPICSSVE